MLGGRKVRWEAWALGQWNWAVGGRRRKCTEHFSACLTQGFNKYLFLALSSPPLVVVIRGQGSLLMLAVRGISSTELVGFPPRPVTGCWVPCSPQCLTEPSQREDAPLVQGKQGHTRSAPGFKGPSVRKLFFMFPWESHSLSPWTTYYQGKKSRKWSQYHCDMSHRTAEPFQSLTGFPRYLWESFFPLTWPTVEICPVPGMTFWPQIRSCWCALSRIVN